MVGSKAEAITDNDWEILEEEWESDDEIWVRLLMG
jgi:hypothetical protein